MVRRSLMVLAMGAWAAALCFVSVSSVAAQDVSALFGNRVTANARFKVPFLTGDFTGDGAVGAVYLVTVLPASPQNGLAGDVTVIDTVFGQNPLGAHGAELALAIVQQGGHRKFLLTGYQGEDVTDYFDSPIWGSSPVPLRVARRGSKLFREFQSQEKRIKNDILVVGTEAGIDTALYWNGRSFRLFAPNEEP